MALQINSKACQTGLEGEVWVMERLQQMGYDAKLCSNWYASADILIPPLKVEVKTANPHKVRLNGRNRLRLAWELARLRPETDYAVVLLAVLGRRRTCFVCPSWIFFGRSNMAFVTGDPELYAQRGRGYLSGYYERWDIIEEVKRRVNTAQLPLFEAA